MMPQIERIALILLVGVAAVLLVNALGGNREAIAAARVEAARLQTQRDSLLSAVADRDRERSALISERERLKAQAANLRQSVAAMDRARADEQFRTRRLRTSGQLLDRLRATFPELHDSAWALTTVPLEGDSLGLEYLMVPAWFAETFAIDHVNARSWRQQKNKLLAVDSLRLIVTALQDSVTQLVAANANAFEQGYQTAYTNYQALSDRYLRELQKPRIRLGPAIGLVGAAGIGLVIGKALP